MRGERERHVAREKERERHVVEKEREHARERDVAGCASYIEAQEGARSEETE